MVTTQQNKNALNTLLAKADPRRADRADDRPVRTTAWTGSAWQGECEGSQGETHRPRITLVGQRSFNCTCRDKQERAREVGPCKHVISLARMGLQHLWMLELMGGSNAAVAA